MTELKSKHLWGWFPFNRLTKSEQNCSISSFLICSFKDMNGLEFGRFGFSFHLCGCETGWVTSPLCFIDLSLLYLCCRLIGDLHCACIMYCNSKTSNNPHLLSQSAPTLYHLLCRLTYNSPFHTQSSIHLK